jgi:hypothetical protein
MTLHDLYESFIKWEHFARDIIDFKRLYVDMTAPPGSAQKGNALAGLMLSQIVYYHLPDRRGHPKLHIERDGHLWLVKKRTDWWEECRLTPKQVDRCLALLGKGRYIGKKADNKWVPGRNLIVINTWKYANTPTHHIRLNFPVFLETWQKLVDATSVPILPDGENGLGLILPDGENPKISTDGEKQILPDRENPRELPDGENLITKDKITPIKDKDLDGLLLDIQTAWPQVIEAMKAGTTKPTWETVFNDSWVESIVSSGSAGYLVVLGVSRPGAPETADRLPFGVINTARIMLSQEMEKPPDQGMTLAWKYIEKPPEIGKISPPAPGEPKFNPLPPEYKDIEY